MARRGGRSDKNFHDIGPLIADKARICGTPDGRDALRRSGGIGDFLVNYRLQLLEETDTRPAIAPRVSAIFPSGSESRGLGAGTTGWEFDIPVSKIVADRWTVHGNAAMTVFPGDVVGDRFAAQRLVAYQGNADCTSWECTRVGSH